MGKHTKVGPTAKAIAALAATVTIPFTFAPAANAGEGTPPEKIAECESGGDPDAQNSSSSASGKWQFIDSTWAAYGGTEFASRAKHASEAEQDRVAARAYAAQGTTPWAASRSCWGGSVSAQASADVSVETSASHQAAPALANSYEVQRGDTLSGIALDVDSTISALVQKNDIDDVHYIYPGDRLSV